MKDMVIACTPVDKEAQLKVRILSYTPAEGTTQGVCEGCNAAVFIGVRQAAMVKTFRERAVLLCYTCSVRKLEKGGGKLRSLGGNSGEYSMVDSN
jgi:hypothetical protein